MAQTYVPPQFPQAEGVNASERFLSTLAKRTFLTFWSFPNLYARHGGQTKEVCDLFVLFEDHLIVFSDKECAFSATGDIDVSWRRWAKVAVENSCSQLWGAHRVLRDRQKPLFIDPKGEVPFPKHLPPVERAKIHLVAVAKGASERCRREVGGSGSLGLDLTRTLVEQPFAVGALPTGKHFIHVVDEVSLPLLLSALTTVSDFVSYLEKKERLIESGRLRSVAGEEDLLATYLAELNPDDEHDFPAEGTIEVAGGRWEHFTNSPERKRQLRADEPSYVWDQVIERFVGHYLGGTSQFLSHTDVANQEELFRWMAREPRVRRRMLSNSLGEMVATTSVGMRRNRVVEPSRRGDPHWVFLVLPQPSTVPEPVYRAGRRALLEACCRVAKLHYPDALHIVGMAINGIDHTGGSSEDLLFIDGSQWTAEDQRHALKLREDFGLFTQATRTEDVEREYPD